MFNMSRATAGVDVRSMTYLDRFATISARTCALAYVSASAEADALRFVGICVQYFPASTWSLKIDTDGVVFPTPYSYELAYSGLLS